MCSPEYNGWKNYETWCMALWIDNDQGSYNYSRELAAERRESWGDPTSDECYGTLSGYLADALREWQDQERPELEASVWSDLLNAGFSEVDWLEIADAILESLDDS